MATPFRLKRSSISGKRPLIGDLELGELALNFYDGYLFARRDTDGVGIADTVSLLNPWVENYGGSSIHYLQSVGIGTTSPSETLTVHGNSYVSGNFNTKTLTASTVTSNNGIFTSFSATGVSTFSSDLNIDGNSTFTADLDINAAIDVDGHTELDELRVSGVSTFVGVATFTNSNVYIDNQLFVGGIQIDGGAGGGSSFAGIVTFTDTTNNTLGESNTGALQVDGGVGIDKNLTVGAGLSVGATLNIAGVSTFQDNVHLLDSDKLLLGGIAGTHDGLEIYHDSNNSYITDSGSGNLLIGSDNDLWITNAAGTENKARFTTNGGVNLYYDNAKKFETTGYGVTVFGTTESQQLSITGVSTFQNNVHLLDNDKLLIGGSVGTHDGLEIYHDSNHSYIDDSGTGNLYLRSGTLSIQNLAGSKTSAVFQSGSSQQFYFNNSKKLETTGYGATVFGGLHVSGISTFSSDLDINAAIDVDGHTELDELNVAGIATFTNATDNTLGDSNTGALQIDGGLGVDKNVTIGGNLNVQGYSELVGVVTFKGGTINIGDANTDDINVAGEFISSLIPNDDDSYDLGSDSKQWRNIYIDGQAEIDDLNVAGITTTIQFNVGAGGTVITTTETGLVGINSTEPTTTLDVDGTINSSTDVTINGTSVITTATNDAVALAIALG